MAASTAELRKAFDKMDHDGSGELDRDELMQLMQIMEPRRGITNDELDAAMKEIDTGGDGLVDFNEFSTYYQNHMSDDGGVLGGLIHRMGSLTQTAADQAYEQVKINRALIDNICSKWALDKVEEAEVKVQLIDMAPEDLTINDLRSAPLALLNQILKKCPENSREYKLVRSQIEKRGPASAKKDTLSLSNGKKIPPEFGKYMEMGPGQIKLAMQGIQTNLQKLKKGKATPAQRKQVQDLTKEVDQIAAIFNDRVHYSGLLTKKGGKKGTKGADERWFALEMIGGGNWALEYFHPKTYKLLGQIPIDNKCAISQSDSEDKKTGTWYNIDVTCTAEDRTFFLMTQEKKMRDDWYLYIRQDAGIIDMNEEHSASEEEPEEIEEEDDDLE